MQIPRLLAKGETPSVNPQVLKKTPDINSKQKLPE